MSTLTENLARYAKICVVDSWADTMGKAVDRINTLEAAAVDALSSLVAAVSLLERGGKPSMNDSACGAFHESLNVQRLRGWASESRAKAESSLAHEVYK